MFFRFTTAALDHARLADCRRNMPHKAARLEIASKTPRGLSRGAVPTRRDKECTQEINGDNLWRN